MYFARLSPGIEIKFEHNEIETVRASYEEHIARTLSLGNNSSVSEHEKDVVKKWGDRSLTERYRGGNHTLLAEKLRTFWEVTEERVDVLLDEHDNPDRIVDAGKRYELGSRALELLESVELQASMDVELENLR